MNKSTLEYYREGKTKIGYESCYRNNTNSLFLARARINSLKLEEAKGRGNKFHNKICKLCGLEEENLAHFIITCPKLEHKRDYDLLDNNKKEAKQVLVKFLYEKGNYQEKGEKREQTGKKGKNGKKREKKGKKRKKREKTGK